MGVFAKKDEAPSVTVEVAEKAAAEARGHYDVDEHLLSPQEVADKYEVHVDFANISGASKGLSALQVKERQAKYGQNRLTPPKETPEWVKFLLQFTNPLMLLLLVAGGLTYMAYGIQNPKDSTNLILASALVIVVTLTCCMSWWQERTASNVMASLKKMMPAKCTVIRDGMEQKVDAMELVPGDLVRLYIGDRVPADIRIIETADLRVECSSLTGESDLVPASVDKKHDLPAEARNLVFMSSLAMLGEGRGIVVRTGDNTMIGKIATLASDTNTQKSTLQIEVHRLVVFVSILAFCIAVILFVIGLGRKTDPLVAFVNGFILVIVANVPEGLPATLTSLLSLTALRLKDRNVLIKRTDIIENLGVATIIASDKTGTLTQNRMTVENVWCNSELHRAADFQPPPQAPLASLARASNLAKKSQLGRASRGIVTGPTGQPMLGKGSVTRPIGRVSSGLGRVSLDPSTSMTIGRSAGKPRGDGTFEVKVDEAGGSFSKLKPVEEKMSVSTFSLQSFVELSAVGWSKSSALTKLVTLATVCNKAKFTTSDGDGSKKPAVNVPMFQGAAEDRKVLGDATDAGLLRYCDRLAPSSLVRMAYKKIFEIPFNSANKWALTVTECPGSPGHNLVMMKGAPEIILTKCSDYHKDKQEKPIDEAFKGQMQEAYERCGFMGERVIGFAYKIVPAQSVDQYREEGGGPPTEGLVFMGLISLVDPPREGVMEAVNKCRSAGIRVAMVTGDHPLTAEAIARKVGIVTLQTQCEVAAEENLPLSDVPISDERVGAVVITGSQLRDIKGQDEWDDILTKPEIVFARTSPQQKLQIVENLQRLGEVVAVTGDGVNDSPALKRAQIGVAMGKGGSDVAREAADIVLLDDQFPSIVNAIEEGRVIYDNLKKTIAYTLAHAVPEVLPLALALILNFPVGLGGLLILSIDLLTEQGPAISLAYEKAEANVMDREPRDPAHDRLIGGPLLRYSYAIVGLISAVSCMLAFFTIFWWYDVPLSIVFNNGPTYWQDDAPDLLFDCTDVAGQQVCSVLTAAQQTDIYYKAQTAWYVTLITNQFWHIWMCKTRRVSIFAHGLFKNPVTIFGVIIAVIVMVGIAYLPFLQPIFLTGPMPGIGWVPNLMFLLIMLPYTEYSKYLTRKDPEGWWARNMQW